MSVAYYCQHVLGIGHFHRSLEICKEISKQAPVTLILGGPDVDFSAPHIDTLKLPGLKMDENFQNLTPTAPSVSLEKTKERRLEKLINFFKSQPVGVFITELYPFGRKAFRFEVDPLLQAIKNGQFHPCKCYSSTRDILVEKTTGREKFEARVVNTLNSFYDGVLIHSDPNVITLDQTFDRYRDIKIPLYYTGYVSRKQSSYLKTESEQKEKDTSGKKLIIASIGGGSVGSDLLESTIKAVKLLDEDRKKFDLQIFTGPYCSQDRFRELEQLLSDGMKIDRFTNQFPKWLSQADLSISMAGYNSCINLAEAGIPALVQPFAQNQEQRMRAELLSEHLPITVLEEADLAPAILAKKIKAQLDRNPGRCEINLDGARGTVQIVKAALGAN